LSRFRIDERISIQDLGGRIDDFLLGVIDYQGDIQSIRSQLVGALFKRAATGNSVFTPSELLEEAGLTAESLENWSPLRNKSLTILEKRLRQTTGYEEGKNVRQTPPPKPDRFVTVLAGESGQGKTWELARYSLSAASGPGLVVFTRSSGDGPRDLASAADMLWKQVMGHDQTLDVGRLASRIQQLHPQLPAPVLILCIDDVQSAAEFNWLMGPDHDWEGWKVQLVVTASPRFARQMKAQWNDRLEVIRIEDFSTEELNCCSLFKGTKNLVQEPMDGCLSTWSCHVPILPSTGKP